MFDHWHDIFANVCQQHIVQSKHHSLALTKQYLSTDNKAPKSHDILNIFPQKDVKQCCDVTKSIVLTNPDIEKDNVIALFGIYLETITLIL